MRGAQLDVAVVGDGPAGLALAAAGAARGLDVAVVGVGRPWTATYGTWVDDVDVPGSCFGHVSPSVVVHAGTRHEIDRAYGIVDNDALQAHLARHLDLRPGPATGVQHFTWGSRVLTAAGSVDARFVVWAAGRGSDSPGAPAAWQTAYGVVLDEPPARFDQDLVTFMDLRTIGSGPPTFCYVVPVADGWLVEETVLAARPVVDPSALRSRLATRIGADAVEAGRRVETVTIPMGGRLPARRDPQLAFGAAAGYTHPATGYSLAASLRAAPRVAGALATAARAAGTPDPRPVWEAVWPRSARRTRLLHDHGLEVLLRLGPSETAAFFDAFFSLPVPVWSAYLRVDAPPRAVSAAMTGVLRQLPWSLRRRVLATPPWTGWDRRRARPAAAGS